jgi:hypothetical protein
MELDIGKLRMLSGSRENEMNAKEVEVFRDSTEDIRCLEQATLMLCIYQASKSRYK